MYRASLTLRRPAGASASGCPPVHPSHRGCGDGAQLFRVSTLPQDTSCFMGGGSGDLQAQALPSLCRALLSLFRDSSESLTMGRSDTGVSRALRGQERRKRGGSRPPSESGRGPGPGRCHPLPSPGARAVLNDFQQMAPSAQPGGCSGRPHGTRSRLGPSLQASSRRVPQDAFGN